MFVDDLGSTGSGGPLSAVTTVALTVDPVNDAPVLALPVPVSGLEDSAVGLAGITVSDIDVGGGNLELTLSVTTGTLTSPGPGVAGDGTATLIITGTPGDINSALAVLDYVPPADFVGGDTLNLSLSDLGNTGIPGVLLDVGALGITISPVNDAPVIAAPGSFPAVEDVATAVAGISVSDIDAGASVITVDLSVASGTLTLTTAGLAALVGDGTANLQLSGPVGDINTSLASLSYLGNTDFEGADLLSVLVDDGGATGLPGPLTDLVNIPITVTGVNDAPVLSAPATASGAEEALIGLVGLLVTDSDGSAGVQVTISAQSGTLTTTGPAGLAGDGTALLTLTGTLADVNTTLTNVQYLGDTNFFGEDKVTVTVDDQGNSGSGGPLTDTADIFVTVTNVNDGPLAGPDSFTLFEDNDRAAVLFVNDVLINDIDVDNDTLTVNTTPTVAPVNGILTLNADGTFLYTPTADFAGGDSFTYEVNDGNGGITTAVASITVNPFNDAPSAGDDTYTTTEDVGFGTSAGIDDVLQNDSDIEGDALTVNTTPVRAPDHGLLTLFADGSFSYTPDADFNGIDGFDYVVDDGNGGFAIAHVTINVDPDPDLPTATGEAYATSEDQGLLVDQPALGLLANDVDADGDSLSLLTTPLVPPANGVVMLNGDGTFSYTPNADFNGADVFQYQVTDGTGTSTATATINVSAVNDLPVIVGTSENVSAIVFHGPNDFVAAGRGVGDALAITGNLTLETWLNVPVAGPNQQVLGMAAGISGGPGDNNLYLLEVLPTANGDVDVRYSHGNFPLADVAVLFDTNLNLDTWYHLAVERDTTADTVSLYVDGQLFATQPYTTDPSGGGNTAFFLSPDAALGAGAEAFTGMVHEIRIWDSLRGAAAIAETSNKGIEDPDAEVALVGYWNLDDPSPSGEFASLSAQNSDPARVGGGLLFDGFAPVAVFDGTDSILTQSSVGIFDHSFELLVAPDELGSTPPDMGLFHTVSNGSGFISVTRTSTRLVEVTLDEGDGSITYSSSLILPDGDFTHFAYTWDAGLRVIEIYIDGVRDENVTVVSAGTAGINFTEDVVIGESVGGTPFIGKLAEFRLWDGVRDPAEILEFSGQRLLGTEADLQLYYRLDQPSGSLVMDNGPVGIDGTVTGDIFEVRAPVRVGHLGGVLDFDGAADGLDAGRGVADVQAITGDLTIEAWIKPEGASQNPIVSFQGPGATAADNILYELHVDVSGFLGVAQENGANLPEAGGLPANITVGQWHHVAAIRDISNLTWTLMVDGNVIGEVSFTVAPDGGTLSSLLIGTDGTNFFDSEIADVRVWDTARTPDDVRQNLGVQPAADATGLAFSAMLDDDTSGPAGVVSDGQGNVLTVLGAPVFEDAAPAIFATERVGVEDGRITGQVQAIDLESGVLTYALDSGATHGLVVVDPDGSYTFTPDPNFSGTDSFTFSATDGDAGVSVGTVDLVLDTRPAQILAPPAEALTFHNNADSLVNVGHTDSLSLDSFTISVWVRTESLADDETLVQKRSSDSNYELRIADGFLVGRFDQSGGGTALVIADQKVNDGDWHHVAVVHDAGADTLTLFIDGLQDAQSPTGGLVPAQLTSPLAIGNSTSNEGKFAGSLYDLRIYADVRTLSELISDAEGRQDEHDPDLVLWHQFDSATYPLVVDQSGNGNHGISPGDGTFEIAPLVLPASATPGTPVTISGFTIDDAESSLLDLTIRVEHGTVELTNTGSLNINAEDDLDGADGTIRLVGELPGALTDALLSSIVYTPDSTYTGVDSLTLTVEDGLNVDSFVHPLTVATNIPPATYGAIAPGNALHLDGVDDYAAGGDVFDPGAGSFTLEAWVYLGVRNSTSKIIAKGNDVSSQPGWSIETTGDNYLSVRTSDGTADAGQEIYLGDRSGWHHVALVIDRGSDTIRGFLDGSNDNWGPTGDGDSLSLFGPIDTIEDFTIGGVDADFSAPTVTTVLPYQGMVDEVRVWSVARTDSEIGAGWSQVIANPGGEANLVSYYQFDDVTGVDQIEDVKGGADLTLGTSGAGDVFEPVVFGYTGRVVEFDGLYDSYDAGRGPADVLAITGDMSIEFWLKLDNIGTAVTLLEFAGPSVADADNALYSVHLDSAGDISFAHRTTGLGVRENFFDTNLTNDVWYHVALVRDNSGGGTHSVYIDGVAASLSLTPSPFSAPDDGTASVLTIGGDAAGGELLSGQMEDLRIWSRVLSGGEVNSNLRGFVDLSDPDLVANFHMNDEAGGPAAGFVDVVNGIVASSNTGTFVEIAAEVGSETINAVPGVPTVGRVLGGDVGGFDDNISFQLTLNGEPEEGTVVVNADGSFVYTAAPGTVHTTDTFTVRAVDEAGGFAVHAIGVNINVGSPVSVLSPIVSGDWNLPGTWPEVVPTAFDDVLISNEIINVAAPEAAHSVQVQGAGSVLQLSNSLVVSDFLEVTATNSLVLNGPLTFGSKVTSDGVVTWNGAPLTGPEFLVSSGTFDANTAAIHNLDTTLSVGAAGTVTIDGVLQGSGAIDNRAGVVNLTNDTAGQSYTVGVTNRTSGTMSLIASTSPSLSFSFTGVTLLNAGLLLLDDLVSDGLGVTLTFDPGQQLTNSGTLRTQGASVDDRVIDGDVVNTGTFEVDHNLRVVTDGNIFDTSDGAVVVAGGEMLEFDAQAGTGTVHVGTGTNLSGSGEVVFTGTHTVELLSNFHLFSTLFGFNLDGGAVTFQGSGDFVNEGNLVLSGTDDIFNVVMVNNGRLALEAGGAVAATTGNFNSGLINHDVLVLNDTAGDNNVTLNVGGSGLYNQGTIWFDNTGGGSSSTRLIAADVTNDGVIDVDSPASIDNVGRIFDTSDGALDLRAGETLTITDGTTYFGDGTTLLGAAGDGDALILEGGEHYLHLLDDFFFDSEVLLDFAGTVTVTGASWINQSPLRLYGADDIFAVSVVNEDVLTIRAGVGGAATLNFSAGLQNQGDLVLDATTGDITTIIVVGDLVNSGVLRSTGVATPAGRIVDAQLINAGSLDIDVDLTLLNSGRTFDTSSGEIDVASAATLTITGGTTRLGSDTLIFGVPGNTDVIALDGVHTLELVSTYFHDTDADLELTGTVTVSGADWVNISPLTIADADDTFNVRFFNTDLTRIEGDGAAAAPTFANGFINAGELLIDSLGVGNASILLTGGELDNFGTLRFANTGGNATSSRDVTATLNNHGKIVVDYDATLTNVGRVFETSTGVIDVSSASTFVVTDGQVNFGDGTRLLGGSGTVELSGTVNLHLVSTYNHGSLADLDFSGAVTVTGSDWLNEGTLVLYDSDDFFDVTMHNNNELVVEARATTPALVTFNQGLNNFDLLILDDTDGVNADSVTITVNNGDLSNFGVILGSNSGAGTTGARTVMANVMNRGTVRAETDLTIMGDQFDTSMGIIDVSLGANVIVNTVQTTFDDVTRLIGSDVDNSDQVQINSPTLLLAEDYVHSTDANLYLTGVVTVVGSDFVNDSLFITHAADDVFNVFVENWGTLLVEGQSGTDATLTVQQGLANSGTILLDDLDNNMAVLDVTGGQLFNDMNGEIRALNTGGATTGPRVITASIDNHGQIIADVALTLNGPLMNRGGLTVNADVLANSGVFNYGDITVSATQNLTIASATSLVNAPSAYLEGTGTVDVSLATFENNGVISPGFSIGTLTVLGDVVQSSSAFLEAEVAGAGVADLLAVTGSYEVAGTLDLRFDSGHTITSGDSFTVVTFGSLVGTAYDTVFSDLAAGYDLSLAYNVGDITVTVNAGFESEYDGGGAPQVWTDPVNWTGDVLPLIGDDVLIDGFAATHSTLTNDVHSLSLENAAVLTVSGGNLRINGLSRVEQGAQIDLTAGTLTLDDRLVNDGVFNFTGGTLNGVSGLRNLATFTSSGGPKVFDIDVENEGVMNLQAFSNTLNGFAHNTGTLVLDNPTNNNGTTTFAFGFDNEGTITIDNSGISNSRQSVNILSGALTNTGTIVSVDTAGGLTTFSHEIDGEVINRGVIDVDASLDIDNAAALFDTRYGTLDVAAGQTLALRGGIVQLGQGTVMTGAGTIAFESSALVFLDASIELDGSTPQWDLTANVDVFGPGTLTIRAGAALELEDNDIDAPLVLQGQLDVTNSFSNITDYFRIDAGGQLSIDAVNGNNGQLFAATLNNSGTITLDHSGTTANFADLDVGLLVNEGTVLATDTAGGAISHSIDGSVTNWGLIDVDADLRVDNSSETFDTTRGTIDIAAGTLLEVNGGILRLGANSVLQGAGTLDVSGSGTVDLSSNIHFGPSNPQFATSGTVTINGPGRLTLDAGATLELQDDTVNAELEIAGDLTVLNAFTTINTGFHIAAGGSFAVDGVNGNNGQVFINGDVQNEGVVLLDHGGTTANFADFNIETHTLTNKGTILSQDTGGGAITHVIDGSVWNLGVIDVDHSLNVLNSGEVFESTEGTLDIALGETLSINDGTVYLDEETVFTGGGILDITGGATLILESDVLIDNSEVVLALTGTPTVEGPGTLIVAPGSSLQIEDDTLDVDVILDGQLEVRNSFSNINGVVTINPGGELLVDAINSSNGQVFFTTDLANAGTITLEHSGTTANFAEIDINGLVIFNDGLLQSLDTNGGAIRHNIDGSLTNTGILEVRHDLRLENSAAAFDSTVGFVFVEAGSILEVNAGLGELGSSTWLTGAGDLEFASGANLTLASELILRPTQPTLSFTGTSTINGPGALRIGEGVSLVLDQDTVNAAIVVDGLLSVQRSTTTINGPFDVASTGTLHVGGSASQNDVVVINTSFQSTGTVLLDNTATTNNFADLDMNGFEFLNFGSFISRDTGGGNLNDNTFDGSLTNSGNLVVEYDLHLQNTGHVFDTTLGNVEVGAGATLRIDSGDWLLGPNTVLSGAGTIEIVGSVTADIGLGGGIDADTPTIDTSFGNLTVNGLGPLLIEEGGELTLTSDTVNAAVFVAGDLNIINSSGTASAVNGSLVISLGGTVTIDGASGFDGRLDLLNPLVNTGRVVLDHSASSNNFSRLSLSPGDLLTNVGVIDSIDTGGPSTAPHVIDAILLNTGTVNVAHDLQIALSNANHSNVGEIILFLGATFEFGGLSASLTNEPTGLIAGIGTIDVAGTGSALIQNGDLFPGDDTSLGTLAITGSVIHSGTSRVILDIAGTGGGQQDTLAVFGDLDQEGTLVLDFLPGHGIALGPSVSPLVIPDVLVAGSLSGGGFTIEHDLSAAYNVTTTVLTASNISLQVTASFDTESSASGNWSVGGNWLFGAPAGGDDIEIGNADVITADVLANPGTLTIHGTSSLIVNADTLLIDQRSRSDFGTSITVEDFGIFDATTEFIVDGLLLWDGGTLGGNIRINTDGAANVGTLDLVAAGPRTLNATLVVQGDAAFLPSSDGSVISGTGDWQNYGTTFIEGSNQTISTTYRNFEGGTLHVAGHTADASLTLANELTNDGLVLIDNFHLSAASNATLTLTAGSLTNNNEIRFDASNAAAGGDHTLAADVINNGLIKVSRDATINLTGGNSLQTLNGAIDVDAGYTLTVSGGAGSTLFVDQDTALLGAGDLLVTGIDALDLASGLRTADNLTLTIEVDVTGSGILDIDGSATLVLDGVDVASAIFVDNWASLVVGGVNEQTSITEGVWNRASGVITVEGATTGATVKIFGDGLLNDGLVEFDQTALTDVESNIIEIQNAGGPDGLLENYGTFNVVDSLAIGGDRIFNGLIENYGVFFVDHRFEVDTPTPGLVHLNFGSLEVTAGNVLTLGADDELLNDITGVILGEGTIDASASGAVLTSHGEIVPGSNAEGILTVVGDLNLTDDNLLEMEIGGLTPGVDYDQLVVTGTLNSRGALRVTLTNAFVPATGNLFTLLSAATLLDDIDIFDGLDISATQVLDVGFSATDLILTVVDVTDLSFTAGDDVITATGGVDVLMGGDGDDQILLVGAGDTVYGQGGRDLIDVSAGAAFKRVDGGDGIDTLLMPIAGDYTASGNHWQIDNIEVWSLRDAAPQTIQIDEDVIRNFTDGPNALTHEDPSLVLIGDEGDVVQITGSWFYDSNVLLPIGQSIEEFTKVSDGSLALYVDQFVRLEITAGDGARTTFGGSAGETLSGTPLDDFLDGRLGADTLLGGDSDDTLVYDPADTLIDGGSGIDTLLFLKGADVDLGFTENLTGLEKIDLRNGNADTLDFDIRDVLDIVTDNDLESLLPDSTTKLVVDGEVGDTVILNGVDLSNIVSLNDGMDSSFVAADALGDGELYVSFFDVTGKIQVLVHEDLVSLA